MKKLLLLFLFFPAISHATNCVSVSTYPIVTVNCSTTKNNEKVVVNASGGTKTITLNTCTSVQRDWVQYFAKSDSSGNAVTIDAFGSQTIDGSTTKVLSTQRNALAIICDGAEWNSFSGSGANFPPGSIPATTITDDSITEAKLKAVNSPTDEFCLTYETSGGGDFEWTSCGGASGITINTTTITGGTPGRILYDNAGTVGELATLSTFESDIESFVDLADLQGILSAAKGGTGDDTSATTGIARVDSGNWTYPELSGDVVTAGSNATTIQANSVALTTDTTGNYAAGDAEAGNALTGDSATAFFSSGTIEPARISSTAMADDSVWVGDSSSAVTPRAVPDCDNATTSKLLYDTGTNAFSCGTDQAGGGITIGTTAITSGTDTRVLYDKAGVVGEDSGFTFAESTNLLTTGLLTLSDGAPEIAIKDTGVTSVFTDSGTNGITRIVAATASSGGIINRAYTTNATQFVYTIDAYSGQTTVVNAGILLRTLSSDGSNGVADITGTEPIVRISGLQTTSNGFFDFLAQGSLTHIGTLPYILQGDTDLTMRDFTSWNSLLTTGRMAYLGEADGTNGGLAIQSSSINAAGAVPMRIDALHGSASPTQAPLIIRTVKTDGGTNGANLAAGEKGVQIQTNTSAGTGGNFYILGGGMWRLEAVASPPVTCSGTYTGAFYIDTSPAVCWCNGTAWTVVQGTACS